MNLGTASTSWITTTSSGKSSSMYRTPSFSESVDYSADYRHLENVQDQTIVVRAYDHHKQQRFVCVLYDEPTEIYDEMKSFFIVSSGEGRWRRRDSGAVRIL